MEQLNKVELRGVVGSASTDNVGGVTIVKFSVATNYVYMSKGGDPVIETTWHQVSALSSLIADGRDVQRGDNVYVCGRLRRIRYTDSDGIEKVIYEIMANKVQVLDTDRLDYPRQ